MTNSNTKWKLRNKKTLTNEERISQLEGEVVALQEKLDKTINQFRGVVARFSQRIRSLEILNIPTVQNGTKQKVGAVAKKHDKMFQEMIQQEGEELHEEI